MYRAQRLLITEPAVSCLSRNNRNPRQDWPGDFYSEYVFFIESLVLDDYGRDLGGAYWKSRPALDGDGKLTIFIVASSDCVVRHFIYASDLNSAKEEVLYMYPDAKFGGVCEDEHGR